MKVKKLTGLILAIFVTSGFVFAKTQKVEAQKEETQKTPQVQRRDPRANPVSRTGSRADRSQMMRERMQKQMEMHQAALKELEDIKKIAEEEGATKTAKALQKLIDKKDTAFKERLQQFEKARRERALRLQEKTKKGKPETEKPVKKAVEDKTEDK